MSKVMIITRKGRTGATLRTQTATTAKGAVKSVVRSIYEALLSHDSARRYVSMECRHEQTNNLFLEVTVSGHNVDDFSRDKIAEAQDEIVDKTTIAAVLTERMSTYAKQMEDLAPCVASESDKDTEWGVADMESYNVAMGSLMATRGAWDAIIGSAIPAPTREELLA